MSTPTPAPETAATAEQELQHAFRDILGAARRGPAGGLTVAQIRGLVLLSDAGEMTAGELAKAAEITPASVTGMVDGLERDGMVTRQRSAEDRRRVTIALTAQGVEFVAAKRAQWYAMWEQALAGLSPEEIAAATVVLRRLADGMADHLAKRCD
jgi:MarR family transcriptional regulator, organic hydroperoxide resistance regulator